MDSPENGAPASSKMLPVPSMMTLFALLYAWANILHQLSYPEWVKAPHVIGWLLFVSSCALALKPSSTSLFLGTLILRIAYTFDWMPMVREHLFLQGVFSFGILVALIIEARRMRTYRCFTDSQREALFESFAPFLRVVTIVVYVAVTLCKLNWEFFDIEKSESANLLLWTARNHAWVPTAAWAQTASIWLTLLFEGGIPVLLLIRRTRWLGIIAGLLFHTILGVLPLNIWSFTAFMVLLLSTWLPPGSAQVIYQTYFRLCNSMRLKPFTFGILFYALVGAAGLAFALWKGWKRGDLMTIDLGKFVWWWQTIAILGALWAVRGLSSGKTIDLLRIRPLALKFYLLLILVSCISPYIGLKNRLSMTMHSNLRTAPGYWNHMFLPESLRVFGFQGALVTIVDSDLDDFEAVRKLEMPMPYFEFCRWCRRAEADFYVDYLDPDGMRRRFEKVNGHGSDPELMKPRPVLEKLLCFNPIGANYDYMPESIPHIGPSRNMIPRPQPDAEGN